MYGLDQNLNNFGQVKVFGDGFGLSSKREISSTSVSCLGTTPASPGVPLLRLHHWRLRHLTDAAAVEAGTDARNSPRRPCTPGRRWPAPISDPRLSEDFCWLRRTRLARPGWTGWAPDLSLETTCFPPKGDASPGPERVCRRGREYWSVSVESYKWREFVNLSHRRIEVFSRSLSGIRQPFYNEYIAHTSIVCTQFKSCIELVRPSEYIAHPIISSY